jgi:hypothetical protein
MPECKHEWIETECGWLRSWMCKHCGKNATADQVGWYRALARIHDLEAEIERLRKALTHMMGTKGYECDCPLCRDAHAMSVAQAQREVSP